MLSSSKRVCCVVSVSLCLAAQCLFHTVIKYIPVLSETTSTASLLESSNKVTQPFHLNSFFPPVLSRLLRDDALVLPTQTPGLRPHVGLLPFGRHGLRGSRAEDAGEAGQGDRGAAADGERLHQGFADVRGGDHRAAAEKTGRTMKINEQKQGCHQVQGWPVCCFDGKCDSFTHFCICIDFRGTCRQLGNKLEHAVGHVVCVLCCIFTLLCLYYIFTQFTIVLYINSLNTCSRLHHFQYFFFIFLNCNILAIYLVVFIF